MDADLLAISEWSDGLLALLRPAERRKLASQVAKQLRKTNQDRIAAQRAPDGTAFAPRKQPLRKGKRKGPLRKRGQMFRKLRSARWLKMRGSPDSATVMFVGSAKRLASVHHWGERDLVNRRRGITHQFASRPLLGITDQDAQRIEELVLKHLSQ